MSIKVALNILEHFPSLTFFQRAKGCELLLLRDDYYYRHQFYHNRTRILTTFGPKWIEAKVYDQRFKLPINKVKTSGNWKEIYRKHIVKAYSKHPYFSEQMPMIDKILLLKSIKLGDYNYFFIKQLIKWLKLPFKAKRVTGTEDLDIAEKGFRLNDVLRFYEADKVILSERDAPYVQVNIEKVVMPINHTPYPQKGHTDFVENVSIIDALMNLGSEDARRLVLGKDIVE